MSSPSLPSSLLFVAVAFLGACSPPEAPSQNASRSIAFGERPTNVIFFVSDGAGAAHWTLAAYADEDLALRQMKTVGLVDTRGADHTVSGSAPTATAYATGVRSVMGAVGVDANLSPAQNLIEHAMARGMSTGVMTTTDLADATPAAFTVHVPSRRAMDEIARQMVTKGVTVLMGGGRAYFRPESRADGLDVLTQARESYTYVSSITELRSLDPDTVDALLGLFSDGPMGVVEDRGPDALSQMVTSALDILGRDPDGFFLMVENEQSDEQSHDNAGQRTITEEMLDFDRAVRIALEYQSIHPETLVIVTGDHETGGLALAYDDEVIRSISMRWPTSGHTGTLVPLFASGPGAERFGGIIRNDEVGRILRDFLIDR
jgi:alkaline phosphatase